MNLRVVIIDEPIHIYDEFACDLWRKALWAKELGYRKEYKTSVLPLGGDDFFATHAIVAEELKNGTFEPVVMYKIVRRSQCERFKIPFGAEMLLKGTQFENSSVLKDILKDPSDISYDSSWSINPKYKKNKEFSQMLRDYITMFCCNIHNSMGYHRWITAGVTQFKIDNYFEWLGGRQILPEFQLPIIDNSTVRMFYVPDTRELPQEALDVAQKYQKDWDNRIYFAPTQQEQTLKLAA